MSERLRSALADVSRCLSVFTPSGQTLRKAREGMRVIREHLDAPPARDTGEREPSLLRLEDAYTGVRFGNAAIPERISGAFIFDAIREYDPLPAPPARDTGERWSTELVEGGVQFSIGSQHFTIRVEDTDGWPDRREWYRSMLHHALRRLATPRVEAHEGRHLTPEEREGYWKVVRDTFAPEAHEGEREAVVGYVGPDSLDMLAGGANAIIVYPWMDALKPEAVRVKIVPDPRDSTPEKGGEDG